MGDRSFFEDLSVGQLFYGSPHMIDARKLRRFAEEFDPQPFHLEEDAAASSVFSSIAGSGWHNAAVTIRLLVKGGLPVAGGIIGASAEVAWPRPTPSGDELKVVSEVIGIRPSWTKRDRGIAVVRSATRNHRVEVVQVMTATFIEPRRERAWPVACASRRRSEGIL